MSPLAFIAAAVQEEEEEEEENRDGDPCAGEEGRVVWDGDKVG